MLLKLTIALCFIKYHNIHLTTLLMILFSVGGFIAGAGFARAGNQGLHGDVQLLVPGLPHWPGPHLLADLPGGRYLVFK